MKFVESEIIELKKFTAEMKEAVIAIFKDRVEIRNPGGVFGDIRLEQIIKGQAPIKRRNPLIADLFNRIHFGERWGRGIRLILSKEPNTEFRDISDVFVSVFKRQITRQADKTTQKILELIKQNPKITKKEMAQIIGITEDGIVNLFWSDNSGNEENFIVQRSADGVTWEEVGRVGADVETWRDESGVAGSGLTGRVVGFFERITGWFVRE